MTQTAVEKSAGYHQVTHNIRWLAYKKKEPQQQPNSLQHFGTIVAEPSDRIGEKSINGRSLAQQQLYRQWGKATLLRLNRLLNARLASRQVAAGCTAGEWGVHCTLVQYGPVRSEPCWAHHEYVTTAVSPLTTPSSWLINGRITRAEWEQVTHLLLPPLDSLQPGCDAETLQVLAQASLGRLGQGFRIGFSSKSLQIQYSNL
jgi:hypothetical protein